MAATDIIGINAAGVRRYYRTLVSAYNAIRGPAASAARSSKASALPLSPADEKRALIKELKKRINSLERQLQRTKPLGWVEHQKFRRLETKIDIFKSKLETMQG
jgi:hypothetical protein